MRVLRGLVADLIPFSWVDGPGNRTTVFLQGCNFDCLACHNPHTIATDSVHARRLSADDLVEEIRPHVAYICGVTVSGGEATGQPAFLREFFGRLKGDDELDRLTCFIDSNGAAAESVWRDLLPVTDGVMLDLKTLDPELHLRLTGQPVDPVLSAARLLADAGLLYEVRLLIVPGVNDDAALLRRTGEWLATVAGNPRVVLNPFRTHGVRSPADRWQVPTALDLAGYAEQLRLGGATDLTVVTPITG